MAVDAATFDAILADIRAGAPTYKACAECGVPRKAFYAHIAESEEAGNKYARAKEVALEAMADDIIAIADDSSHDDETRYNEAGEPYTVANVEYQARSRLRVDSRKWLLAKLAPKKYGEKLDVEMSGSLTAVIQSLPHVERPAKD